MVVDDEYPDPLAQRSPEPLDVESGSTTTTRSLYSVTFSDNEPP
jgi:hypothetical protein